MNILDKHHRCFMFITGCVSIWYLKENDNEHHRCGMLFVPASLLIQIRNPRNGTFESNIRKFSEMSFATFDLLCFTFS